MSGKETTDYLNVVNPFICKAISEVRIQPDKDPRKKIDENKNVVIKGEKNTYLYNPTSPNLTYTIGEDTEKELVDIDKYDYEVPADVLNEKRTDGKILHKDGLPLSFIQIDNEVDGIDWYKKHYPKIPTDLLSIIARYHWGEPITKKGIKNEKKKIIKKKQQQGLKVLTSKDNSDNPFTINFD
tara:strand:- start:909 stop:1457 length:549 start_codon:yes stop_codon:yes gene_type:complete